ncbi:hypothetical protein RQP46_007425 [Phenoliferia psychrophenolica]
MVPMAPDEHLPSPGLSPSPAPSRSSPGPHHHHQRTSSSGSRSFKETLNAFTADGHDGTHSVNQYILKERLGQGSYATVERATDRVSHIDYAVKTFSKARLKRQAAQAANKGVRQARGPRGRPAPRVEAPEDPDEAGPQNLSLVRSEVAIMKKVNHPNVASVHEVIDVTSSDALLVVMELCAGGPITQVSLEAQSAPMEEWRARDIFGQMLMGIAYLHHNCIIHRDIKPDNCLFMEDLDTVKLVDFGVSQMFTKDSNELEKSTGSPAFMAPELLAVPKPEHTDGYACDIWSFGVTLFAMVAGRLPFMRDNIFDLMQAIKEDEVDYPTTFSPSLTSLLRKMLDRDPSTRITAEEMWSDPWVTDNGANPLPSSYDENCRDPIVDPSPEELESALLSFHQKVLVARAANKFRKFTSKSNLKRESSEGSGGVGESPPNTMPSLTTLPTELKRHIATMVAAQRQSAAEYFQLKIDDSTPWHGRGSNALFHVSKEWSALVAPVVFETVSAAGTLHPTFRNHEMRRHSTHIRHLDLTDDRLENGDGLTAVHETHLPHLTLIAPMAFPNLKEITIGSDVVTALANSIAGATAQPEDDGLTIAAFKAFVRPLTALKICSTRTAEVHNGILQTILPFFPNITSLSFEATEALCDYELETTEAIDRLVHLQELSIMVIIEPFILDQRLSMWKPNIPKVDVYFRELGPDEWTAIGILARNAEEVVIRTAYIVGNFEPPSHPFHRLHSLTIHVEVDGMKDTVPPRDTRDLINPILRGISPAPLLRTINLHSTSLPPTVHIPSSSLNAKINVFTTQADRSPGSQPLSDASVKLARGSGPIWGWKAFPMRSSDTEELFPPRWRSTSAIGILHQALAVAERHRATGDEVGSGKLMQALSGLEGLLATEKD